MPSSGNIGHRQRLRQRFLAGEEHSRTEEATLELLLTYAIPQKDVQPLAKRLLARFGDFSGVLGAEPDALCAIDGMGDNSATLVKLVDWIRASDGVGERKCSINDAAAAEQPPLFDLLIPETAEDSMDDDGTEADDCQTASASPAEGDAKQPSRSQRGTGLFGKAMLKEAIDILPRLPDSDSLEEIRQFLRANLHFSSEQTRNRNANYIIERMFPQGHADRALRTFARAFSGRQELRDVCYYRFCKAEPVMLAIVDELVLPSIGGSRLARTRIREYVGLRASVPNSVNSYTQAIANVLIDGGVARADREVITVAYREILTPSFCFVLHSEFAEPGMYDISQLESNPAVRAMLWNPDRILPSLYELRNLGLISKVSEIDRVRQFTTRCTLDKVVGMLTARSEAK